ncbi:hypothetical protein [Streptacidiphilus pinicola]|uniref:hypothetical protein n=1 Tax=Streptacidiphilus pinicola TaxID=2219663 RepID=UPI001057F928|nr:hypothetical protein [Streptacidiphilus pinicola]
MTRSTTRRVRNAALAGSAAVLLSVAAPVTAWAAPPGNNGHIQIHDTSTPVDTDSNDPNVGCFYIDAFDFDANQALSWSVFTGTAGQPGNQVAAGTATFTATAPHGQDISGPIALPQGMYVAFEDDSAGRKSKEFKVNATCNSGVPLVNAEVAGVAGAIAVPAVLGYVFWRRRNAAV